MPQRIHHLAVNEFTGQDPGSGKWGTLASDKLSGMLQDSNQKSNRYSLVDRQGLKKILEERDLQMAFSDPEQAARHAGKLKAVDAIIYGSILTTHEQVRTSKMSFDFSTQRPKTIYYNKLCCSVTVNFRMVDVTNGTMLATRPVTKAFDSDKDAKQSLFAKLMGKQDTPPDDQVLGTLIDKAVADFVAYISPREETVNARLAAVRSAAGRRGNTLAQDGDYDGALQEYVAGLAEKPNDDGACSTPA